MWDWKHTRWKKVCLCHYNKFTRQGWNCFHSELFISVDVSDTQWDFGIPKLQKHTTWLCEFQPLKKFREAEHTLAWFCSSLAIRGSGGGLVWPQIHEIWLCLANGWDGDTRDFAGLDFQVCLLDISAASTLIQGACLHWWPINQLLLEKGNPRLWAKKAQYVEPCDCSTNRLESSFPGMCFSTVSVTYMKL